MLVEEVVLEHCQRILRKRAGEVRLEDNIKSRIIEFSAILDEVANELDVVFDPDDEQNIETVQDLIEMVEEKLEDEEDKSKSKKEKEQ